MIEQATDEKVYCAYLCAFATAASGGEIRDQWSFGHDVRISAARALGVSTAKDAEAGVLPWIKVHVLAEINEMMTAKAEEERPCKVVPMNGDEK